jgi:outer membrane protein TolC
LFFVQALSAEPINSKAVEKSGITQSRYLELIVEKHPNFLREGMSVSIVAEDTQIQAANEDWELTLKGQQAHQEELFPSFGPEKVDQSSVSASVGRQIWATGAFVSLDVEQRLSENEYAANANNAFPSPSETDEQQVSLTFSQPLLKNFRGSQSRLAYDLSLKTEEITQLQTLEAQEQFLSDMLSEYLDWASLSEEVRINLLRFTLAQNQADEIEKRYKKNYVEKIDWLRAQDSLRLAEQQYLLSQSQLNAKSSSLSYLSNLPQLASMKPDFDLYAFPELPTLESLLSSAEENLRTIRMLDLQHDQFRRQAYSLKNETRPELNLDLRAAYKEEEQEGLDPAQEDSDDGQDYSVGLNFKKRLGVDKSKREYRKTQMQMDQLVLEKQYAQMELRANITNLYIQLTEMRKVLSLNETLAKTAQQTIEEERRVYRQGRSDLTNVISSRDQSQNTQLQYARNAINFHKLYLQLNVLTDQLLRDER